MYSLRKSFCFRFFVCLLSVVMLLGSFAFSPEVSAFSYPKIALGKTMKGDLEDYFGGVSYELNLASAKKVKIIYSSTTATSLCVYDGKLNTIFKEEETEKVNKTLSLKKGTYVFGIYNCTYNEGTYSLNVKDGTAYTKSIEFSAEKFTLAYGKSLTLKFKKNPSNSTAKNLTFSSSDKTVVAVDKNGKVKARAFGQVTITAKIGGKAVDECKVVVNERAINVFETAKKSLPKINGKSVSYKSADSVTAKISGKNVKGISQGKTTLTASSGGEKYKITVYVTSHKKLLSAGKKKLKNALSNPKSLVVFNTYRGYNSDGKACVVIDYGVKKGSKVTGRKYFICYYNSSFKLKYSYSETMLKLSNQKEL